MTHHQQHRALRTRPRGADGEGRYLQGNNNKNQQDDPLPTDSPTFAPTMAPTKKAIVSNRLFEGSLSLEWSVHMLTNNDTSEPLSTTNVFKKSDSPVNNELKHWIAQDFVCRQDTIWLTSDMKNLDSDCQATIRRTQDTQIPPASSTSEQRLHPERTILWNDPVISRSRKILEATDTEFTVVTIEYPVYSYADRSEEKWTAEQRAQELLNQQIEDATLVWEDGILSIVGNEIGAFAPNNRYWLTDDQNTLFELGPFAVTPLQTTGAIMAIVQTMTLIVLHIFLKPYLKDGIRRKKMQKEQLHVYIPPKRQESSLQSPRSPSSRRSSHTASYMQADVIPVKISIPGGRKRDSASSSAYPMPY
ncbi:MAG: hypothetical protein SGBAC_006396 [Bacillariaceae sp.]